MPDGAKQTGFQDQETPQGVEISTDSIVENARPLGEW